MNIAIVTIAFNGYGRFLPQWLAFVSSMTVRPTEIVVVLGKDHGCEDIELLKSLHPYATIIEHNKQASFGYLRNIAIANTTAEWTWLVSVDDKPISDAISTFNAVKDNADYICSQYYVTEAGKRTIIRVSPTPAEMAVQLRNTGRAGFIVPHSPFKRWLWEKHEYKDSDLPNYDFVRHCVINGARFAKGYKPTTTYMRRHDSHSRTTLKRHDVMAEAVRERGKLEMTILEYYGR